MKDSRAREMAFASCLRKPPDPELWALAALPVIDLNRGGFKYRLVMDAGWMQSRARHVPPTEISSRFRKEFFLLLHVNRILAFG